MAARAAGCGRPALSGPTLLLVELPAQADVNACGGYEKENDQQRRSFTQVPEAFQYRSKYACHGQGNYKNEDNVTSCQPDLRRTKPPDPLFHSFVQAIVEHQKSLGHESDRLGRNMPIPFRNQQCILKQGGCVYAFNRLAEEGNSATVHSAAATGLSRAGVAHSAARRSGNSPSSPCALAGATPRSVMRPVTRRAGVTSKAGLPPGVASGEMRTKRAVPSSPIP